MKKYTRFLLFCIMTFLLSGCMVSSKLAVTNSVSLNQANFKVVHPLNERVRSTHFLAMGGWNVRNAKENVILKWQKQLKPNQALADIHFTESYSHFIPWIFYQEYVSISAVVVEFINDDTSVLTSQSDNSQSSIKETSQSIKEVNAVPEQQSVKQAPAQAASGNASIKNSTTQHNNLDSKQKSIQKSSSKVAPQEKENKEKKKVTQKTDIPENESFFTLSTGERIDYDPIKDLELQILDNIQKISSDYKLNPSEDNRKHSLMNIDILQYWCSLKQLNSNDVDKAFAEVIGSLKEK